MAKVRHTKNELKEQREALRRYARYLPILQLKKQQLQLELRQIDARIEDNQRAEREVWAGIAPWIKLLAEPFAPADYLRVESVRESAGSVAGVTIPVLEEITFAHAVPDLHRTPPWLDDALVVFERLVRLTLERGVLGEQQRRISDELRTTSQRVNLFERVKIPEAEENIRVIRIVLGDQQTASVARAKIAKGKSTAARGAA
jgi:V/A-type H+-transporting ATPase subunit D